MSSKDEEARLKRAAKIAEVKALWNARDPKFWKVVGFDKDTPENRKARMVALVTAALRESNLGDLRMATTATGGFFDPNMVFEDPLNGKKINLLGYAVLNSTPKMVREVLALPGLDPNSGEFHGPDEVPSEQRSPITINLINAMAAARYRNDGGKTLGRLRLNFRHFVRDPRTQIAWEYQEAPPGDYAIQANSPEALVEMLASGKRIKLGASETEDGHLTDEWMNTKISGVPRRYLPEFSELLADLESDYEGTRQRLIRGDLASEYFATALMTSDEFLRPAEEEAAPVSTHDNTAEARAARFWRMMVLLPMELQMVVAHRAAGSTGTTITWPDIARTIDRIGLEYGV